MLAGIGVGLGLQVLAAVLNVGLLGGLPSYFVMGVLIGVASPGRTIVEPGAAAFVLAAIGFVIDRLFFTLYTGGLGPLVFGALGLVLGVAGGYVGEKL